MEMLFFYTENEHRMNQMDSEYKKNLKINCNIFFEIGAAVFKWEFYPHFKYTTIAISNNVSYLTKEKMWYFPNVPQNDSVR